MFAEERHLLIAALVAAQGRVTVTELANRFGITAETVRRDLDVLEATRMLRRVHGGAVGIDHLSRSEPSLDERQTQHLNEKSRIADAAWRLIPASRTGSIVLDAGSTTERLADRLVDWTPAVAGDQLLVITNAVPIAAKLSRNEALHLHILGGLVRGLTSAIVGAGTVAQLGDLRPDIAFIGTNGISATFGLSTPDLAEAAVKTAIVASARRVVVLADCSKLDQETLVCFAALDALDTLITDAAPSASLAAALAAANVDVVLA